MPLRITSPTPESPLARLVSKAAGDVRRPPQVERSDDEAEIHRLPSDDDVDVPADPAGAAALVRAVTARLGDAPAVAQDLHAPSHSAALSLVG